MFGWFKKKEDTPLDLFIYSVYGNPPRRRTANLTEAVHLAQVVLLRDSVSSQDVERLGKDLYAGRIPYSTHDLALSIALNFFQNPRFVPRLRGSQIEARMTVLTWLQEGKAAPLLVKSFEEVLYNLYRPERFAEMVEATRVTDFIVLNSYSEHYLSVFTRFGVSDDLLQPKVLFELYLFRCWSTRLGFLLFSSYMDVSERIGKEVDLAACHEGLEAFELSEDLPFLAFFEEDFVNVYVDRIFRYNEVVRSSDYALSATAIVASFMEIAEIFDLSLILALADDFGTHLAAMRSRSIESGLLVP